MKQITLTKKQGNYNTIHTKYIIKVSDKTREIPKMTIPYILENEFPIGS